MIRLLMPSQVNNMAVERKMGKSYETLSEEYGINPDTVSRYLKLYEELGLNAFTLKSWCMEFREIMAKQSICEAYDMFIDKGIYQGNKKQFYVKTHKYGIRFKNSTTYKVYEYKGLKGVPAIAKKYGLSVNTMRHKLAKGYTVEQVVEGKDYSGVYFQGLRGYTQIAKHFGISRTSLYWHVYTNGKDIRDAIIHLLGVELYNQKRKEIR